MNFTYFISDIHLDPKHPEIVDKFLNFLQQKAPAANALYILGDLFESWVGDDDNSTFSQHIKTALKNLSYKIPVYFIHGNRDFVLGQRFAQDTGIILLAESVVVDLYHQPVLLLHGDLLCTDDHQYQAFRKKAHSPGFQKKLLRLPLFIRRWIAAYARYRSKRHTQVTDLIIQDVNQQTVVDYFKRYLVSVMIHGHTHRPAAHTVTVDDSTCQRLVLAAWHGYGEALKIDAAWNIQREQI